MLLRITSQWPEQEWLFFFEDSAMRCFHTTLRLGNQGCRTVLTRIHVGWLFFLKNPDYVRGGFFGLMDVHLLTRADVMLYFRQLFACRCDLITNAARNALDIYLLTPANVMLYFRPAFACRCDLIANCCPRLSKQHRHIFPMGQARLCWPEA